MTNSPHVLITGASSGIGRAVAVRLAANGNLLVLRGRDAERLDEGSTYDLLYGMGDKVMSLFLGVRCSECFTFTHCVEHRMKVFAQCHRLFTGYITMNGCTWEDTYFHFAQHNGIAPISERNDGHSIS